MFEEEAITLIAQYGFPIFMCLWFMFRTEKIIKANTEALLSLSDIVGDLYKFKNRRGVKK